LYTTAPAAELVGPGVAAISSAVLPLSVVAGPGIRGDLRWGLAAELLRIVRDLRSRGERHDVGGYRGAGEGDEKRDEGDDQGRTR
jgi:hypothetical protein